MRGIECRWRFHEYLYPLARLALHSVVGTYLATRTVDQGLLIHIGGQGHHGVGIRLTQLEYLCLG
jgi:hypothetical protein